MRVTDFESIRIKLASPDDILTWSHGEVTKPETINYRTQRAEKDGLFCEKIFGPEKDYECYCGKYRRIRYKGVICDKCGVEVTKSSVRRERMGHIKLASPVSHIWFLKGVPSRIGLILDIPIQQLEKIIYFAAYIIKKVDEEAKKRILEEIDREYKSKVKNLNKDKSGAKENKTQIEELKSMRNEAREDVMSLKPLKILSENEYNGFSLKYGECFEAGTGSETLRKICEKIDLREKIAKFKKELKKDPLDPKEIENLPSESVEEEKDSASGTEAKRKLLRRLRLFESMERAGIRPEWMFLTALPVLPPDLRPMVQLDGGRYASSDLNDLYRRVINRNNRLKYLLEIDAPEVIVRNEKRMLQEAVDSLIDNEMRSVKTIQSSTGGKRLLKSLADMLKGKKGRFRQNLLGKRVDYSGRSVIVVGPNLKLNQCGLPKKMALELFKPFIIKRILDKELAFNIRAASRLIEQETDEVWAILEEVVSDKLVLLNRAPTLHRLGIQAFQPILIEGEAIQIHPFVCKAFNADFDGDQMAVHLPLSVEAQKEAGALMLSTTNLLKPATGRPIVMPTLDIVLGCYWLTRIKEDAKGSGKIFSSADEAILAHEFGEIDLRAKIKAKLEKKSDKKDQSSKDGFFETSLGRIIFNETLPPEFDFLNDDVNSKKIEEITYKIIKEYGMEGSQSFLDKIKNLGFEYATESGISWGMDDLTVPAGKKDSMKRAEEDVAKVIDQFDKGLLSGPEKSSKIIEIWTKSKSEVEKMVPQTLPKHGSAFSIINSGSKGSWSQAVQMAGMKGLVINPMGEIIELPIKNSFKEGFDVLEFFISTHGARKGTADTALRTSAAGYLTRRLIDVAHDLIITEEDCGDKEGLIVRKEDAAAINQDFYSKILGRTAMENINIEGETAVKKGEIISEEVAKKIAQDSSINEVKIRSPFGCKSYEGLCQQCYGWDLGRNRLVDLGEAVGIVAAQAIGEPGTQLTMRTFHAGGIAGGADITQGLPRIEEIFESRIPNIKAKIALEEGKVEEISEQDGMNIVKIVSSEKTKKKKSKKESDIIEYKIAAGIPVLVKKGELIKRGQQLSEGYCDIKELFSVCGFFETQSYIIKEIQKIYISQGVNINDKHLEVITKQMFSRVRIKNEGDSCFVPGDVVEKTSFVRENHKLLEAKKEPATCAPLVMGISKISLTSDSFLSAASFQETSRVLIKASLEGKEDKLRGLKENVIIGKLIPAGTGFRKRKE